MSAIADATAARCSRELAAGTLAGDVDAVGAAWLLLAGVDGAAPSREDDVTLIAVGARHLALRELAEVAGVEPAVLFERLADVDAGAYEGAG